MIREIRAKGARLWSCAPGEQPYIEDDADDPSRKFIRQILGATAEYEKALITLRLRSGRAAKRAKGGYTGGPPMFGFTYAEGGGIKPDLREQEVLRRMRRLRSAGHTLEEVARRLNTMPNMRPREGKGKWTKATVHKYLKPRSLPVVDEAIASA